MAGRHVGSQKERKMERWTDKQVDKQVDTLADEQTILCNILFL